MFPKHANVDKSYWIIHLGLNFDWDFLFIVCSGSKKASCCKASSATVCIWMCFKWFWMFSFACSERATKAASDGSACVRVWMHSCRLVNVCELLTTNVCVCVYACASTASASRKWKPCSRLNDFTADEGSRWHHGLTVLIIVVIASVLWLPSGLQHRGRKVMTNYPSF